jgi:hypothetical protein
MNPRLATIGLLFTALPLGGCGGDGAASGDEAGSWAGKKYFLSMRGDWSVPRGIGSDIDYFVPSFLLEVSGASVDTLSVTIGAAQADATVDTAVQDLCGPTQTVVFSGGGYPKSELTPDAMRVHIKNTPSGGAPVQATGSVYGFTMTDALPETGSTTTGGKFKATMDLRELYQLFTELGPTVSPENVCEILKDQFTPVGCESDPTCWVACGPCPNDSAPYCFTVEAEDIGAVEAPNLSIVEVTEASRPATCVDPLPSP